MTTPTAVADASAKSVTFDGTTYKILEVGEDTFTVLHEGVPVAKLVYSFGAANGVPEGDALDEDGAYAIAEAWFAAIAE